MFFQYIFIVLSLSAVGYGIPLEDPSENMEKFFDCRIVGGCDAPEDLAPHMAALIVGTNFAFVACGASIVSPKMLLTAAHCIDAYVIWGELMPSFHGLVGTNTINLNNQKDGLRVDIENFYIHPEWDWGPIKNDIGLLAIVEPLTMSQNVQVIEMNLHEPVEADEPSFATGFGNTQVRSNNRLQMLPKMTIAHKDCAERIDNHIDGLGYAVVDPKVEVCAFNSKGRGVCNGDSGSALVSMRTKKLIGVVSWGFPCALGVPDVYASPYGLRDFINFHMQRYQ